MQFLFSPLSTYLRTRRFNRPTFRKNTAFRDFANIWRGCIFFLLTFTLLHLLSADLTTLLCFSTVHIVGSLLFKLPSMSFIFPQIPRTELASSKLPQHAADPADSFTDCRKGPSVVNFVAEGSQMPALQ